MTLADEDGYSKVFDIITDFESDAEKRAYKRQLEIVLSILGIMLFRACLVVVLTKELNSGARYALPLLFSTSSPSFSVLEDHALQNDTSTVDINLGIMRMLSMSGFKRP